MPPDAATPCRAARRGREAAARPGRGPDGDLAPRRGHAAGPARARRPRLPRHRRGAGARMGGPRADRRRRDRAHERPEADRAHRRQPDRERARARRPRRLRPRRRGRPRRVRRGGRPRARGSPPRTCRTCSSASTRPTLPAPAAAPGSASPSRSRTPASWAATSRSGARPASAPASRSVCLLPDRYTPVAGPLRARAGFPHRTVQGGRQMKALLVVPVAALAASLGFLVASCGGTATPARPARSRPPRRPRTARARRSRPPPPRRPPTRPRPTRRARRSPTRSGSRAPDGPLRHLPHGARDPAHRHGRPRVAPRGARPLRARLRADDRRPRRDAAPRPGDRRRHRPRRPDARSSSPAATPPPCSCGSPRSSTR